MIENEAPPSNELPEQPDYLPTSECAAIPDLSPTYWEGYKAAKKGLTSDDNPHIMNDGYDVWEQGFLDYLWDIVEL